MIQTSLTGITNLPRQIGHHAARFLMFAEKSDGDAEQLSVKNIYSAQVIAWMAAAYLRVNCRAFQLQESIEVRAYSRMLSLLSESNFCGMVDIPPDPI